MKEENEGLGMRDRNKGLGTRGWKCGWWAAAKKAGIRGK